MPIRVLMAKIGMDGHDAGIKVVAAALRDAGMDVVYTGPYQTIESVAETALQEDVDIVGISSLATDHVLVPKLIQLLRERELAHITVVVGGIIPDGDARKLKKAGVAKVFLPGTPLNAIVDYINKVVNNRKR